MYAIDAVLLQETKTAFPSDTFLKSTGSSSLRGWRHLNSLEAASGQLIGWCDDVFDYSGELVREFVLSVRLTHRISGQYFVITSAYGPYNEGHKADFWQELHDASGWVVGP